MIPYQIYSIGLCLPALTPFSDRIFNDENSIRNELFYLAITNHPQRGCVIVSRSLKTDEMEEKVKELTPKFPGYDATEINGLFIKSFINEEATPEKLIELISSLRDRGVRFHLMTCDHIDIRDQRSVSKLHRYATNTGVSILFSKQITRRENEKR